MTFRRSPEAIAGSISGVHSQNTILRQTRTEREKPTGEKQVNRILVAGALILAQLDHVDGRNVAPEVLGRPASGLWVQIMHERGRSILGDPARFPGPFHDGRVAVLAMGRLVFLLAAFAAVLFLVALVSFTAVALEDMINRGMCERTATMRQLLQDSEAILAQQELG